MNTRLSFLILVAALIIGCASSTQFNKLAEENSWKEAVRLNTYASYTTFQKKHLDSKFLLQLDPNKINEFLLAIALDRAAGNTENIIEIETDKVNKTLKPLALEGFIIRQALMTMLFSMEKDLEFETLAKVLYKYPEQNVYFDKDIKIFSKKNRDDLACYIKKPQFPLLFVYEDAKNAKPDFWRGTHTIIGNVVIKPWEFVSNLHDPLTFIAWPDYEGFPKPGQLIELRPNVNYQYQKGKGLIVGNGKVYLIGISQKNP